MSATDDVGAAVDFRDELGAEGKEVVVQAPSDDSADLLLFDDFMFDEQLSFFNGGVYEPAATAMDGLLSGDAVLCNDSLVLWSFDDSVCYY
jgi:hypothetical protein